MHKINQASNSLFSTGFNQTFNVSFSRKQPLKFNFTILDDSILTNSINLNSVFVYLDERKCHVTIQ